MKITIENANSTFSNCSHLLSISSSKTFEVNVTDIISIEDGYRKRDKIVGLKLDRSLLEGDFYLFNINDKVTLIKNDKTFESLLDRVEENDEFTIIYLYSSIDSLGSFFGPLTVRPFECVLKYGNIIQYAEVDECEIPIFEIKGVTSSSAIITISDNQYSFLKYIIRYRKIGILNWNYMETTSLKNNINNLESASTYEIQIMKYCTDQKNSFYSNSAVLTTYSI